MIHYFNPGHETALLNGSLFYHPPARVLKMQEDLAFLPAWYAEPEDYLFASISSPAFYRCFSFCNYMIDTQSKKNIEQSFQPDAIERISLSGQANRSLAKNRIALWGISPASIYLFEKINRQHNLQFQIPEWKEEYRQGENRRTSQKILTCLIDEIPEIEKDILPQFLSNIDEIENRLLQSDGKQVIKSPFSSSGRGLVWLPPEKIAQSERQIISGMLKKQFQVSIEKALDKQLDFSMHFENTPEGKTQFIGYSVFQTNAKGAYEKSFLANQDELEKRITRFIDKELLIRVKIALVDLIHQFYAPFYTGNIGVDMLVYQSENTCKLHPCVEINMRKSMGYLAIRLFERNIHPDSHGELIVGYSPNPSFIRQKLREGRQQYPPVCKNGQIKTGQLNLCPVSDTANYYAYIQLSAFGCPAVSTSQATFLVNQ
jgi:hypothetical protein